MDYEYWLRLAQNYSFRHVDDVLARFRAYETQKSQDREAMAEDRREVFNDYEYHDRWTIETLLDNGRVELSRLASRAALSPVNSTKSYRHSPLITNSHRCRQCLPVSAPIPATRRRYTDACAVRARLTEHQ